MNIARSGWALALVAGLIIAGFFGLTVAVPQGGAIVVESGDSTAPTVLPPGRHIRPFGTATTRYDTLEARFAGDAAVDGAPVLRYSLQASIDPASLPDLHASMKGAPIEDFLRGRMTNLLGRLIAGSRPVEILSAEFKQEAAGKIAESMEQAGFRDVALTFESARPEDLLAASQALAPAKEAWELRPAVTRALQEGPGDWRLHAALGFVNESEALLKEAETNYLDALAIDPAAIPPMERLVTIYSAVGEWERLRRILDAALTANPASLPHINWTALVLMKQREFVGTERILRDGLAIAPDNPTLLANLGTLFMTTDRPVEAVDAFRRAVTADPSNSQALFNLGSALAAGEQWEESLAYLQKAESAGPVSAPLARTLAIVHGRLGNADEAKEYEEAAERIEKEREAPGARRGAASPPTD